MIKPKLLTRKLVIGILTLALVLCAAGWYVWESGQSGPFAVTELSTASFSELKTEFNAAAGNVRVIVLLSPT